MEEEREWEDQRGMGGGSARARGWTGNSEDMAVGAVV